MPKCLAQLFANLLTKTEFRKHSHCLTRPLTMDFRFAKGRSSLPYKCFFCSWRVRATLCVCKKCETLISSPGTFLLFISLERCMQMSPSSSSISFMMIIYFFFLTEIFANWGDGLCGITSLYRAALVLTRSSGGRMLPGWGGSRKRETLQRRGIFKVFPRGAKRLHRRILTAYCIPKFRDCFDWSDIGMRFRRL